MHVIILCAHLCAVLQTVCCAKQLKANRHSGFRGFTLQGKSYIYNASKNAAKWTYSEADALGNLRVSEALLHHK